MADPDVDIQESSAKTITFSGAVVIKPECLQRFAEELPGITDGLSWRANIVLTSGERESYESLETTATLRNPKSRQIDAIGFVGTSAEGEDREVFVALSRYAPTIVEGWRDLPEAASASITTLVRDEIKNARAFYWPITLFGAWVRSGWRAAVLVIAILASFVMPCVPALQTSTPSASPAVQSSEAEVDAATSRPSTVTDPWFSRFWRDYGGYIGGICIALVLMALFPQGVFAIGEGIDRYASIVKWRFVLFSGLVLKAMLEFIL